MNYLIDTHLAIWALYDSPRLPKGAHEILLDGRNSIACSAISAWEVSSKHAKRPNSMPFDGNAFVEQCRRAGFESLPILERHVLVLDGLASPQDAGGHSDPFDRMLICQAKAEGMVLLTHDRRLATYGEPCVLVV